MVVRGSRLPLVPSSEDVSFHLALQGGPTTPSLQPHSLPISDSLWRRHGFPCPEDTLVPVWPLHLVLLHVSSHGVVQTAAGGGGWDGV